MRLNVFKDVTNSNSAMMLIAFLLGLFFAVQLTTQHVNPKEGDRILGVQEVEPANQSEPTSPSRRALDHE